MIGGSSLITDNGKVVGGPGIELPPPLSMREVIGEGNVEEVLGGGICAHEP